MISYYYYYYHYYYYYYYYYMGTSRFDKFGPSRAGKSLKNKNGHEMVKETSPRPLATTVLHEISPRFSWHQPFCELRTSKSRTFPGPSRKLLT